MKKLFSDPHFNVMDGLDTYIDDYGKPNPIPLSMLRRMNQAAVLGLFADESDAAAKAPLPAVASPDGVDPAAVAQSKLPVSPSAPEPRTDDDPDLQLQRDDADRRPGAGPDPGTDASGASAVHSLLCRREAGAFQRAAKSSDDLLVACTQESRLFLELAGATEGAPSLVERPIRFVNIRESGGWSKDAASALPKMAALIAAAQLAPPEPVGRCPMPRPAASS
jgi:hypothetical protein